MNGQNGMSTELNDRLDSALQQIETVSRQLCSVQEKIQKENNNQIYFYRFFYYVFNDFLIQNKIYSTKSKKNITPDILKG